MKVCCCSLAGTKACENCTSMPIPGWAVFKDPVIVKHEYRTMSHGWVCPLCGRANSPQLLSCPCTDSKYKGVATSAAGEGGSLGD